jgi:hypothetical protein
MIRETTAADLLAPLAPLLASLLVVLALLLAVEALRLRLAPSVHGLLGVRWIFRPQASLGLVPQRRALLGRRLGEPRPHLFLGETPAVFPLPLLAARRLKAPPS